MRSMAASCFEDSRHSRDFIFSKPNFGQIPAKMPDKSRENEEKLAKKCRTQFETEALAQKRSKI
jgi:hypothetical protein